MKDHDKKYDEERDGIALTRRGMLGGSATTALMVGAATVGGGTAAVLGGSTAPAKAQAGQHYALAPGELDEYYGLRGWDDQGIPSAGTLERLGL